MPWEVPVGESVRIEVIVIEIGQGTGGSQERMGMFRCVGFLRECSELQIFQNNKNNKI